MSFSEDLRYDYPLTEASVVLDVGAHTGVFARGIAERHGCRVLSFEPIARYREALIAELPPTAEVFPFGIGGHDRTAEISVLGDASSVFVAGERHEPVELRSLERVLDELELRYVHLLKLNVEGCEYEILEHILERDLADRFENIQVQFHHVVAEAESRREAIRRRLAATHRPSFDFPFVWESHVRRELPVTLGVAALIRAQPEELEEWLAYHRLVGVERFWLYDDSSSGALEPLAEAPDVEVIAWPVPTRSHLIVRQIEAYQDAFSRTSGLVRWLALIDLDEFLLPRQHDTVGECLEERFADFAAVYVNWRNFGTGGIRLERRGPILEQLTAASVREHPRNAVGKSIVRPECVRIHRFWNPHHAPLAPNASYADGDGNRLELAEVEPRLDGKQHDALLRINHYALGDETSFRANRLQGVSEESLLWEHYESFSESQDDEIVRFLRERHPDAHARVWGRPAHTWPEAGPFVSARIYGRLGNNLFQIAAASALAWRNGALPVFPDLHPESPYATVFRRCDRGPADVEWDERQEPSYAYAPIEYWPGLRLVGYFQSERYFSDQRGRIAELFAPAPEYARALAERHGDLLERDDTVAVQIRYYQDEDPGGGMYPQYGREYLERASEHFLPSSTFVVSSNNPDFARANLPDRMADAVVLDEGDDCLELYALAACRHAIVTNSSFGWWAAWLIPNPEKRVVRPAVWVHGLPDGDVCPPQWIAVEAPQAEFAQSSSSGAPSNQ